jgi:hypothetical protein
LSVRTLGRRNPGGNSRRRATNNIRQAAAGLPQQRPHRSWHQLLRQRAPRARGQARRRQCRRLRRQLLHPPRDLAPAVGVPAAVAPSLLVEGVAAAPSPLAGVAACSAARVARACPLPLAPDCLARRRRSRKQAPVDHSEGGRRNTSSHRPTTNSRSAPTDSRVDTRARAPRDDGQNGARRSGGAHGASRPAALPFSAPLRAPTGTSPRTSTITEPQSQSGQVCS